MPNLNKVMLMGNLTRDPEVKYTPKGTAVAQLGMAVNRTWSNEAGEKQEEVTFVDVEVWGRTAEVAGEYLKKGSPCFIEGRLKLDTWDDKTDGKKRHKMKVIGEHLQLLGSRDGAKPDRPEADASQGWPAGRSAPRAPRPKPPADPDLDAPEDDIPF